MDVEIDRDEMEYLGQVQPETVVDLLKEEGVSISHEQANDILAFMYMLAEISLDILEKENKTSSE